MPQMSINQLDLRRTVPPTFHGHINHALRGNLTKSREHLTISLWGSQKNMLISNDYGLLTHHESQGPRLKNHLHHGKSMSKRLFQQAKIINDSKKQTFLITAPKKVQKTTSQTSTETSQVFLQIPNKSKSGCQKQRKPRSGQKKKMYESNEQVAHSSPTLKQVQKKSDSSMILSQQQSELKIDAEQCLLMEENNLFSSQEGKNILQILKRNLSNISLAEKQGYKGLSISKSQRQHHKSSNSIASTIRNIGNYQLDEKLILPIKQKQVQPKTNIQRAKNQVKRMTTISQLIMTDDYEMQNLIPVKKKNLPQQPSYEHHSSKRIK